RPWSSSLVFWVWDGRHAGAPRVNGTSIPRTRLFSHYENKICDVKNTYTAPLGSVAIGGLHHTDRYDRIHGRVPAMA
ncbi:MAG TPA: hypothetical protein PKC95_03535, partial [Thauera aminoaromatica]|nr:hypothetical protein [Thauera aminoaromatica]